MSDLRHSRGNRNSRSDVSLRTSETGEEVLSTFVSETKQNT